MARCPLNVGSLGIEVRVGGRWAVSVSVSAVGVAVVGPWPPSIVARLGSAEPVPSADGTRHTALGGLYPAREGAASGEARPGRPAQA